MGGCNQSIAAPLCRSFLLTLFPAPAWGLPTGCRETPAPPGSLPGPQGHLCWGAWSTSCPPPALPSGLAGLFLTLFPSDSPGCRAAFCPFLPRLSPRRPPVAEGLSCALRWGHWSRLEPAVSGAGQPWPLLTGATPAAPRCLVHTPKPRHKLSRLAHTRSLCLQESPSLEIFKA